MLDYLTLQTSSANPTLIMVVYAIFLSFILSAAIAITYEKTFKGLSYSRNFVQALVLGAIVAATIMQAIGDSLARGLAMIGALAIIRFRTNFRDPKDIIFMFAALGAGISCGVYGYSAGTVGTIAFCGAAFLLSKSPFGRARSFDGMLRFNIEHLPEAKQKLEKILTESCQNFALISLRELAQGNRLDHSYHIKLKPKVDEAKFVENVQTIPSIKGVNFLLQDATIEL